MKRSGQVGLMLMGGAAFAATFAGGVGYLAWQKPSHAAQPQAAAAAQNCTTRPDGTQNCQPTQRGFAYYLLPRFIFGGSSTSVANVPAPQPAAFASNAPVSPQPAAFTNNAPSAPQAVSASSSSMPRPQPTSSYNGAPKPQAVALTNDPRATSAASSVQRGGFGTTARTGSYRTSSAGG